MLSAICPRIGYWGSGLGFHFAAQHPQRIKRIAFMEAMVRPLTWDGFAPDFRRAFKMMRTPGLGWLMISVMNGFITQMLSQATGRELTADEMRYYGEPYKTIGSRKPVRQWPLEVPIDGAPADVHQVISDYSEWLQQTDLPKLLFYASPGGLIDANIRAWCRQNFSNLTTVDIGRGIHFVQEDNPHLIGERLAAWIAEHEGAAT